MDPWYSAPSGMAADSAHPHAPVFSPDLFAHPQMGLAAIPEPAPSWPYKYFPLVTTTFVNGGHLGNTTAFFNVTYNGYDATEGSSHRGGTLTEAWFNRTKSRREKIKYIPLSCEGQTCKNTTSGQECGRTTYLAESKKKDKSGRVSSFSSFCENHLDTNYRWLYNCSSCPQNGRSDFVRGNRVNSFGSGRPYSVLCTECWVIRRRTAAQASLEPAGHMGQLPDPTTIASSSSLNALSDQSHLTSFNQVPMMSTQLVEGFTPQAEMTFLDGAGWGPIETQHLGDMGPDPSQWEMTGSTNFPVPHDGGFGLGPFSFHYGSQGDEWSAWNPP